MAAKPAGKLPASPKPPIPAPKAAKATKGASAPATKKPRTDWEAVERDYRTDKFTLRELSDKHGPTHQAIAKMAKKHGWQKDLAEQINAATNAMLVQELVAKEVASGCQAVANVVLAAAEVNTRVITRHRTGLHRIDSIKGKLLDQIEQAVEQLPNLAEVIEMIRNPDENGVDRANDAMRKAMSRTALVDDLKKLTEIDERVRKGEREAHNIPATGTPDADKDARPKKRYVLDFVDVEPRHD